MSKNIRGGKVCCVFIVDFETEHIHKFLNVKLIHVYT
jgi:hypothetical protein